MWPREHGALSELLLPLLVAHWTSRPTVAGWAFTVGVLAAFAAHEPLLVLLGRRGPRARREQGGPALRWLSGWTAVALAGAALGLWAAPAESVMALALPGVGALLVGALLALDQEKTLFGEMLVGPTLAACAVPVAVAGGFGLGPALSVWGVWARGNSAATWAVHATIRRRKGNLGVLGRLLPLGVMAAFAMVARLESWVGWRELVAVAPLLGSSVLLAGWAPHPRHLRRVGWLLAASGLATALLLGFGRYLG